jgi:hypothetical protein
MDLCLSAGHRLKGQAGEPNTIGGDLSWPSPLSASGASPDIAGVVQEFWEQPRLFKKSGRDGARVERGRPEFHVRLVVCG